MFANLCFQILEYFNITSSETVKISFAIFLALLIFGVFYMIVKFTGLEVHNINQNILTLVGVDLLSFAYLLYKRKHVQSKEVDKEVVKKEFKEELKKDLAEIDKVDDEIVEKVKEIIENEPSSKEQ